MHKVYKPNECPADYSYEETCPHCEEAIPVVVDNDCSVGCYVTTCPVCGKTLRLCTLCKDDQQENGTDICDWSEKFGCFRDEEVV